LVFNETVLGDCYPNPFSDHTLIPVYIKGENKGMCNIELSIYTIDGRKVATLAQGAYKEGFQEFEWNAGSGQELKSGIYLYTLVNFSDGSKITKRMVLIK